MAVARTNLLKGLSFVVFLLAALYNFARLAGGELAQFVLAAYALEDFRY